MLLRPAMNQGDSEAKRAAKRDRFFGLGLITFSFIVAFGISLRSKQASMPLLAAPPAPPTTAGIDGFPSAVRPLALEALARRLTPRDQLVGIAISGVRPDGSMDATTGEARFVYRSLEGQGPEPARPYGALAARKYCGFQVIKLSEAGLGAEPDVADVDCRSAVEPLPAPECTAEQLWELGRARGAGEEPADVHYYRARSGPAWYFNSGAVEFSVAADCRTTLSPADAAGVLSRRVPG